MNDLCVGVVTGLKDGKFENQHSLEITTVAGEKVTTYDGISVYEKKQDGSPAKVWPLVKDSYMNNTVYAWSGNVKESDTKAGPKTYATVTWAVTVDEIFEGSPEPSNGSGGGDWGEPHGPIGEVGSSAGEPVTPTARPQVKTETDWDERGLQMEAAWAVKSVLDRTPNDVDISHSDLVDRAIKMALLKREVASELGK